ncbi:MAG: potassium-transporting ATPase subunit KdpC [Burkholderiaceae bacterium]|jgi:K+-transporting ATPase ATPase C chain
MVSVLRPALVLLLIFSVLTGLAYPLLVTGIAQLAFASQAHGSLIERDGKVVGSALIGQPFSAPGYFWSRPSATTPMPDNAQSSGGSNLGPLNPALVDAVKGRVSALAGEAGAAASANPPVPVDLVTTSASGLDPDISPEAAAFQVPRVAKERKLSEEAVRALVSAQVVPAQWGFLGEPRVNVLKLNLALDALAQSH